MAQKSMQATIDKVTKLVALAQSDDEEEARTAAVQAARLMSEHKLAVISQADVDAAKKVVEGVEKIRERVKKHGQQQMLMGLAIGYFGGGGKLF